MIYWRKVKIHICVKLIDVSLKVHFFIYPIYHPLLQHSAILPVDVDHDRALPARDVRRHARVRQHPVDEPRSSELQEDRRVDKWDGGLHGLEMAAGILEHEMSFI